MLDLAQRQNGGWLPISAMHHVAEVTVFVFAGIVMFCTPGDRYAPYACVRGGHVLHYVHEEPCGQVPRPGTVHNMSNP